MLAARLLAVDPRGLGGIRARARAGPVREAWVKLATELMPAGAPVRRVAGSPDDASLIGGLDFSATLSTGRPVMRSGLMVAVHGGVLVLAMAERTTRDRAALICSALDRGAVRVEREGFSGDLEARFALVALDEGVDADETILPMLAERLGLSITLDAIGHRDIDAKPADRDAIAAARARLGAVETNDEMIATLVGLAAAGGWLSARGGGFLLRAARASAALRGASRVAVEDAAVAARLVLGPERLAAAMAAAREATPPEPAQGSDDTPQEPRGDGKEALGDMVLEAAAASLPEGMLEGLLAWKSGAKANPANGGGAAVKGARRGRALTPLARPASRHARLDVLATLRAAAPWQRLRGCGPGETVRVRAQDFRYSRHMEQRGATAVFAVDASGSAAVARLAEAKGAVQLLLADCYVRRDEVALIAYRKTKAEILLEPTRSLVRAKRALSALPGGGGTPLAAGILAATRLAHALERRGRDAISIFLTDGCGNIALDGGGGRARAMADAFQTAKRFRAMGLRGIVIDTGARPHAMVAQLAGELGAEYVALPRGGAGRISATLAGRIRG